MEPMTIFALLGTILSAAATMYNNNQNLNNANTLNQNQQAFSSEQAELANERLLSNYWTTSSPQSRVKQLEEAGLSVGLMYGGNGAGGGVTATTQAQTPAAQLPIMNPILGNGLNDIINAEKMAAEKKNVEKDTEQKNENIAKLQAQVQEIQKNIELMTSQTNLNNVKTMNEGLEGQIKSAEIELKTATMEDQKKIIQETLNKIINENEQMLRAINIADIDIKNKQEQYDLQFKLMKAQTGLFLREQALASANTELTKAKTWLTNNEAKLSIAERQKKWTEISEIEAKISNLEAMSKKFESETELNNVKEIKEIISSFTETLGSITNATAIITKKKGK